MKHMATIEHEGPPFLSESLASTFPTGSDLLPAMNGRVSASAELRLTFEDLVDEIQ